jgi:hypothetical protein
MMTMMVIMVMDAVIMVPTEVSVYTVSYPKSKGTLGVMSFFVLPFK